MTSLHDLPKLAFCGEGLNVEERAALDAAMVKRYNDESLTSIQFWGRVKGTDNDYLIAVGLGATTGYPVKKFYFCTSPAFSLQAFPELSAEFAAKAAGIKTRFKGDPSMLYGEEEEDKGEEEEEGAPPKPPKFSEVHRLAYVVRTIDDQTSIIPRDAYVVDARHNILKNPSFGGLSAAEAGDAASYMHFRQPRTVARRAALDSDNRLNTVEFLDPINEDTPRGIWSTRVDAARNVATIRSLLWPGFFFYHEIGTSAYGSAYFGWGLANADIGFMV